MQAPRAGTRGFRAPEVLLKYPYQTTGNRKFQKKYSKNFKKIKKNPKNSKKNSKNTKNSKEKKFKKFQRKF